MNPNDFAVVLFDSTDTQRVSVRVDGDDLLISKEWRRGPHDDWKIGKGIRMLKDDVRNLNDLINCRNTEELDELLGDYETIQESNTNGNGNRN